MIVTKYIVEKNLSTDNVTVNGMIPLRLYEHIKFTQQDKNTCMLSVKLMDNTGVNLVGAVVRAAIKVPSGGDIEFSEGITVLEGNTIEVVIPIEGITESGLHYISLMAYYNEFEDRNTTITLDYMVEKSVLQDNNIKQESQYGILQECIKQVEVTQESIVDNAQIVADAAVKSQKAATNSIMSSQAAKESAKTAEGMTKTVGDIVELAKQSAEASKKSAEASKTSADESERAKNVALGLVEQVDQSSVVANQASQNALEALEGSEQALANSQEAEVSSRNSATNARTAEESANNSAIILEQKIGEVNTVKEQVDTTVTEVNQANETATTNLGEIGRLTQVNGDLIQKAGTTTAKAEQAIRDAVTANEASSQAVLDSTQQVNLAKQEVVKAEGHANRAGEELAKVTAEGTKQVQLVVAEGTTQVNLVKEEVAKAKGHADRAALELGKVTEEGTRQKGLVATEGTKQIQLATAQAVLSGEKATEATNQAVRAETAADNAENAANNKIGHNGVFDSTTFNFSSREIVQEGLVEVGNAYNQSNKIVQINRENSTYTILFTVTNSMNDKWLLLNGLIGVYRESNGKIVIGSGNAVYEKPYIVFSQEVLLNKQYKLTVSHSSGKIITATLGSESHSIVASWMGYTADTLVIRCNNNNLIAHKYAIYNRVLEVYEQVENNRLINDNSESIDRLITTTTEGEKKEFPIATQGSLVTMQNGYNADQFADGVMDMFKQEFVSADGSPINVLSPMQYSKICGLEIKGQTLKNQIQLSGANKPHTDLYFLASQDVIYIPTENSSIKPNTAYTIVSFMRNNNSTKKQYTYAGNSATCLQGSISYEANENGIKVLNATSLADFTGRYKVFNSYLMDTSCNAEYSFVILEGTYSIDNLPISETFEGLKSTDCILSVQGEKYPFLVPIIEGDSWVEDNKIKGLMATDNTLPNLNRHDYINRATRELYKNAELIFDGTEKWLLHDKGATTTRFKLQGLELQETNTTNETTQMCSHIEVGSTGGIDIERSVVSGKTCYIRVLDSKATTVEQFKTYLQQQSSNGTPVMFNYKIVEPIKRTLTTEEFKAYSAHEKVISLHQVGNVSDSITQDITGNGIWTDNFNTRILTQNDNWTFNSSSDGFTRFDLILNDATFNDSEVLIKSNLFEGKRGNEFNVKEKKIWIGGTSASCGVRIYIPIGELESQDLTGLYKWIEARKPFEVIYTKKSIITTTIDKRAMSCVPLSGREINIHAGEGVGASSFKVVAPVDRITELLTRLAAVEARTNTQAVNVPFVDKTYAGSVNKINEVKLR